MDIFPLSYLRYDFGNYWSSRNSHCGRGSEARWMADADSPILDTSSPNVKARIRQQLDKRSFDYILRSGLAGGVAGCAVKMPVSFRR